ncbi:MAG: DEAD/DEAH box helicase family protein, partial [Synergistaceae bacterium]|nr:DEAD/DEAH box helicase family protein [Synergistaceae bacterium]
MSKTAKHVISIPEAKKRLVNKLSDPVYFTSRVLNKALWPIQAAILNSVRNNPRTAVRSCHGIGKTFTAAMCILWFLYSHKKAIVLSTAPTWR